MANIKEKINDIILQIELIKDIQKDDKIYLLNDVMYYQTPTPLQTLYRTITGETREFTFRYLETFLAKFVHCYHIVKRNKALVEDSLYEQLHIQIPHVHNIIETLKQTYPDNHKEINNILHFFSNSL